MSYTKLVKKIVEQNPLHKKFLYESINQLSSKEKQDFSFFIDYMHNDNFTTDYLSECYKTIIDDAFKEAMYFRKNHSYRYSSFDEAYKNVYSNEVFMEKYMIGLAISSFTWTSHILIRRFFLEILQTLDSSNTYFEVGPGHGIYFADAYEKQKFCNYIALDISSTSLDLTKRFLMAKLKSHKNIEFINDDFLTFSNKHSADFLVIGEVLEHVENPVLFLDAAKELLNKDGKLFLTTCINAPAIDHLYNWDDLNSLEEMIAKSGLTILKKLYLPSYNQSINQCEVQKLPINIAYLLKHKQ